MGRPTIRRALAVATCAVLFVACVPAQAQSAGPIHVSSKAALAAIPSTYQIAVRDGFATAGDAPQLTYVASLSACSIGNGTGDDGSQVPTSDGKCWIADFGATAPDIREWGAKADDTTDNGPFFQKAGQAKVGPVHIPGNIGLFKILSAVTFNSSAYLPMFLGDGYSEYNQNAACPTGAAQGSWIHLPRSTDSAGTAITPFTFGGGVINATAGASGFKNIAFCQDHPTPDVGWAPNRYPPLIRVDGTAGEFDLEGDYFYGIYDVIDARGVAGVNGRLKMSGIRGDIFHRFLIADNLLDRSSLLDYEQWSYYSSDNNVGAWKQANGQDLDLFRVDGFQVSNFFSLGRQACVHLEASVGNGVTSHLQVAQEYCDLGKYALWVQGNNISADIESLTCSGIAAAGGAITGSECMRDEGAGNIVNIGDVYATTFGKSALDLACSGSSIWKTGHLWVDNFNQDNLSAPAINVAAGYVLRVATQPDTFGGTNHGAAALACAATAICDGPLPPQTWTPVLQGSGGGSTTYPTRQAAFTLNGKWATVTLDIVTGPLIGYAGIAYLTGLPFASANVSAQNGQCTALTSGWTGAAGYTALTGTIPPNTAQINLEETGSGKNLAPTGTSELANGFSIQMTCTYLLP